MNKFSHIDILNVSKRYNSNTYDSLKNISFKIKSGEIRGILGPNGAGKTTLISILCQLINPTNGKIIYNANSKLLTGVKRSIGFVPQEFAFYHELTPVQNLKYFGSLYNLNKKDLDRNIWSILKSMNLLNFANKKINTFSGGMKRKINLALGLIHNPSIVFLDEPTAGVDIYNKRIIMRFLKEKHEQGVTIIYSSHDLNEAEKFCSHITLINKGKIVENGGTKDLLSKSNSSSLESFCLKIMN